MGQYKGVNLLSNYFTERTLSRENLQRSTTIQNVTVAETNDRGWKDYIASTTHNRHSIPFDAIPFMLH